MSKLITFTSDFGVQSQGVAAMEAVAFQIAPHSRVIHLMHGLPAFDIRAAARTLETLDTFPIGCHVCVCDPDVGSARRALAISVARGDIFVGPDNGVLLPATRRLGGIEEVRSITNSKLFRNPVSPLFHGRDIFTPVAAHLSNGLKISEVGALIAGDDLVEAPYQEALLDGTTICAEVVQINHFGSVHFNILHELWDQISPKRGQKVALQFNGTQQILAIFARTFSDVAVGQVVIMKDDYGRIEAAINQGNFSKQFGVTIGDRVRISFGLDPEV